MARNEIAEIIGGIFALIVFVVIGGTMIASLSQIGDNPSIDGIISIVFVFSTIMLILAILAALIRFFKDLLDW